ncbi:MAG: glycosyltransferase, partial [Desulfovibrio sp.]|nr:glycosyltransferase [Desulfovibrio sp.]
MIIVDLPLNPIHDCSYSTWVNFLGDHYYFPNKSIIKQIKSSAPCFSLLMAVQKPKATLLQEALESLLAQDYQQWELCVSCASSNEEVLNILQTYTAKEPRIKLKTVELEEDLATASNACLEMARYPFVARLGEEDTLSPHALDIMAKAILANTSGKMFYSDEDKIGELGLRFDPHFKGRWDQELMLTQFCTGHLAVYETQRLREIGGYRVGFAGIDDYEMVLRFTEGLDQGQIIHVSAILYHARVSQKQQEAKQNLAEEAVSLQKAAQEWLERNHPGAVIKKLSQWQRVCYPLPKDEPKVTIISSIPKDLNAFCQAFNTNTSWPHEFLLLGCAAEDEKSLPPNVRYLEVPKELKPAQSYRLAAEATKTELLGFVSPRLCPISPNWLEEIVSCLWRTTIGAVGGKILLKPKQLQDAGYLCDGSITVRPLFRNAPENEDWFGYKLLARSVDTVNADCLFTKKKEFLETYTDELGEASLEDFCLRLKLKKLQTIWLPYAVFKKTDKAPQNVAVKDYLVAERWQDKFEPDNMNIVFKKGEMSLQTEYN